MRKLFMVVAVIFATSVLVAPGVDAARSTTKHKATYRSASKRKAMACPSVKRKVTHRAVRRAAPARAARGPVVRCPAPVVNVPQQPAPVVNVPQQPAPVVNVAAPPPGVAITTDSCNIYILQGNQLTVLDKNTYKARKTVPLQ